MAMPCFAIKVYQGVDMSETNVINVPAPIAYTHAVNKEYIDNLAMQATGETNLFSFAVPSKCASGQISGYTPVSNEDLNISMQFGVNWSTNTRFIVDSTGSNVYDSLTGLMWTKNANDAGEKNWTNAIAYCEALDYGGFDDWRMPNRNELASLIDYSQINPAIPLGHPFTSVNELMTDDGNQNYWTGSTYAKDTEKAWFVSFMNGRLYYFGKGNSLHTWAVRNSVIPFVLQINSPNNGNDYISTTFGSHETNIVGTVSVIPDSLEYTNLFTGVGGSLPPSKTFNFANELQVGTNIITVYAVKGADSEEVSITITVLLPLQVNITSPNNGNDYISTTAGPHNTNIAGTVSVIPDSLVFTNLSTGVGGLLTPSKTFNFANELQVGTNDITVYAGSGADSEEVSITITVPPALQVEITSPNNGNNYTSTTAGSHETNIVGTVSVIPDSLVYTNLFTGVGNSLSPSKTFNFANELLIGTNNITIYAVRGVDYEEVSIIITVPSKGKFAAADPDVVFQPVGVTQDIDTLEWDLPEYSGVVVSYSPFYCSETSITVAQYCRFLNAYKDRFANKSEPSCVVTSVFNEAQGGRWVDVKTPAQLLTLPSITTFAWNSGSENYEPIASYSSNLPMRKVSWYGAVAYCQWLNDVEFGSDTTKWKYRLSTEVEYEFMMGAHVVIANHSRTLDWGNSYNLFGNSSDTTSSTPYSINYVNCSSGTTPMLDMVGNKGGFGQNSKNVFGCYELSGNVQSWCLDWWENVWSVSTGKNYVNKIKSPMNNYKACRGGDYTDYDFVSSRTTSRRNAEVSQLLSTLGFRVVRDR